MAPWSRGLLSGYGASLFIGEVMPVLNKGEIIYRHNGRNTGFGEQPIVYNQETGELRIDGVGVMDSKEFLHLAEKVRQARVRMGLDPDPSKPSGDARPQFVAMRMSQDELRTATLEMAWRNLPNYYPELQQNLIRERIPQARKVLEG